MQLTRTNAVFSRIALVSCFCAESQVLGKFPKNILEFLFFQKTHGARRRDGGGPQGPHTMGLRDRSWPAPGGGVAASVTTSRPLFDYLILLT